MVKYWTIIVEDDDWQVGWADEGDVGFTTVEAGEDVDTVAAEVAGVLASQGYQGEGVLLALDSASCLVAEMPLDVVPNLKQRQALVYELERFLPLPAEDFTADFAVTDEHIVGVATARQQVESILTRLEAAGVFVQAIAPAALLAAQHVVEPKIDDKPALVIWQSGGRFDVVEAGQDRLQAWIAPADRKLLVQQLKFWGLPGHGTIDAIGHGLSAVASAAVSSVQQMRLSSNGNQALHEAVALAAEEVLTGQRAPWIDFSADLLGGNRLYRPLSKLLKTAAAAAAIFLLVLAGVLHVRAGVYADKVHEYEQLQAELFRKSLPGQAIPLGVRSRLESEQARLAALRGETEELPLGVSGLRVLHDVLAALPSGLRLRILEIRIEGTEVYLEGEVRSLSDGDVIAGELRKAGFLVEPPQLARLPDQGMSFRLVALWEHQENTDQKTQL